MAISPKRTSYGRADRRALVTEHAVGDGLGCTLKTSDWSAATGVTDGLVPAMYPIVVDANGIGRPFAGTSGTPAALSGFTLNPVNVTDGDQPVAYVWHGTVDPDLLPVDFDPTAVSGAATSRFVWAKA